MSQEETTNDNYSDENAANPATENADTEEITAIEEADHLPLESIGSYGRIEPLINDETENPEEGDVEQ